MHLRFWVYRRNLSDNPESPFRSNEEFMQKAGFCISGFLGFLFLCLAVLCLFTPEADKDRKLFLTFTGLCVIFEIICFMYSCIPWLDKYCKSSDRNSEDQLSRRSLLSSEENTYEEISGKERINSYQTCAGYPEAPNYQAGPSYQEVSSFLVGPYGAEGGYLLGHDCFRSPAYYEDKVAPQQIPIYQQDLVEQHLPNSQTCKQHVTMPQYNIHVF